MMKPRFVRALFCLLGLGMGMGCAAAGLTPTGVVTTGMSAPGETEVVTVVGKTIVPTAVFVLNETNDPHLRTRSASPSPIRIETNETRTVTPLAATVAVSGVVSRTVTVRASEVISGTATPEYGKGLSNVERAQARLADDKVHFALVAVSPLSVGLEGEIYRDLNKRKFRATTGADEGFDTRSVSCHPYCAFVRLDAANEIGVESWVNVLRHEYRHMVQADHHPNLAEAFRRTPDSLFTTYAAFLEACADDGIFVAELTYHASERMPQVRMALGAEGVDLIERACAGFPEAYGSLVKSYELKVGEGRWVALFPPYK